MAKKKICFAANELVGCYNEVPLVTMCVEYWLMMINVTISICMLHFVCGQETYKHSLDYVEPIYIA